MRVLIVREDTARVLRQLGQDREVMLQVVLNCFDWACHSLMLSQELFQRDKHRAELGAYNHVTLCTTLPYTCLSCFDSTPR